MSKFIPNEQQIKAYKKVIKAIKEANKAGLVFYGKQENLVAYTEYADNYVRDKYNSFEDSLGGKGRQIHNLAVNVLMDSGADDYPCYASDEDDPRKNNEDYE